MYLNTWSPTGDVGGVYRTFMLKKYIIVGQNLRVKSLVILPAHSLCFLYAAEM